MLMVRLWVKEITYFAACDHGYIPKGGNCYKFSTTAKSWTLARKTCQLAEGDLAVIDTVSEADNVKQLRKENGSYINIYICKIYCCRLKSY